jgi:hypothetical protein
LQTRCVGTASMLISNPFIVFFLSLDLWTIGYVVVFLVVAWAAEEAFRASSLKTRLVAIALLSWFGIAVVLNIVATTVYVIRANDVSHMLLIGTVPYNLANGTTVIVSGTEGSRGAVVINDQPNSARFETIRYGSSSSGPGSAAQIGPYSVALIEHRPDNYGPYDRPPSSVKVSRRISGASRYWLTW